MSGPTIWELMLMHIQSIDLFDVGAVWVNGSDIVVLSNDVTYSSILTLSWLSFSFFTFTYDDCLFLSA